MPGRTSFEDSDVLVLGGGFAGVWCARRLESVLPKGSRITLVNGENYFVYQPLLPEVVGASLEPRHAISPLRYLCRKSNVVRADVRKVDLPRKTAEIAIPGTDKVVELHGEHLVLALGNIVDVSAIPGMAQHSMLMKNLADALALRQTVLGRLERVVLERDPDERAALLTFVVIGGGFSGVETAAAILDMLSHVRSFYPPIADERMRVVCVHSRDVLMPEIDPELGHFAHDYLTRSGMEVILNMRAKSVSGRHVYLSDGSRIATRTVVCTVGNKPHPVLRDLECAKERGAPKADEFLRLEGHRDVWAIGDCAWAPDGHGGISTNTAQFAVRQGKHVGDNIRRAREQHALQPFRYHSRGQMAALGHRMAVANIGRFRFRGFFAWWLWRTFYLAKMPGIEPKVRVVAEWTLDLFFPRELSQVDVRTTPAVATVHLEEGDVLFKQGEASDAFYVVLSGCIELTQTNPEGEVVLREVLGRGAHFGEGSMLRKQARTTSARAMESSTCMVVGPRDFEELVGAFSLLKKGLEHTSSRFLTSEQVMPHDFPPDLLQRPVSEVMTTPVETLPADATLRRALEEFVHEPYGCYPLVDEHGKLVGVATRTDLYAATRGDPDLDRPLMEFCTTKVLSVRPSDRVSRCIETLRRSGVKHVPVVDDGLQVVGMVSFRDLVRELLKHDTAEVRGR